MHTKGRVGLINSGGACYLTAVVQALAHLPLLAMYFTSGEFLYDINLKSVFGAQGKVEAALGRLLPAAAGCVQVDARYELVSAVDLEVDARLQTERG